MNKTPLQVIIPTLRNWALRPDAATDLREIFGTEKSQTSSLLDQIRNGDFSWLPTVEVLPSTVMDQAYGAYARETGTIYLESDCPADLRESILLEEIGHHIDALFNTTETPGDEGALFSATVRGIPLSDEEITAILNEDDSSIINLHGRQVAVECASRTPTPVGSRTPTPVTTRVPVTPIVTVKPGAKGTITQSGDWVTSDVDFNLSTDAPTKRGLSLVGGGNLIGIGNAGGTSKQNTLTAASNTGNTTLIAGTASTSMRGGSGDNWFDATRSQGSVTIQGGTGSSTMLAANGSATLVGGGQNNSLVAGTGVRTLGQSLVGGTSNSSLFGNTLRGGTGRDTLRSVAGFSTLISGSGTGVSTTIGAAAAIGVTSIRVASAAGLAVGQQITGNGIAAGTTITAIAGTQLTLSVRTTAAITAGTRINTVGNILIGQGLSNSLVANVGNDSLVALSGNSTLLGGVGRTTMQGGAAGSNNWLQSGSTGTSGNTLVGGAGSNTLVAGTGIDSIVGGANQNLLLVTQTNLNAISNDSISLSTLASARNTLGVSLSAGTSFVDSLISGTFRGTAKNLSRVENVGSVAARIELGANAEAVGVRTLASGTTNDTLSAAGYQNASVLLDGSRAASRVSMVGGARNDTLLGSRGGVDTLIGGAGNDSLSLQNASVSLMSLDGGAGSDTLRFNTPSLTLQGASFSRIRNIENLALSGGSNLVGSLQGSGINNILGGTGSDTLSANLVANVKTRTEANSTTLRLSMPAGVSDSMGFATGQVISGNGIRLGTRISNVVVDGSSANRTITLTLDTPTTVAIASGSVITGFLNAATLNGGTNANTNGKGDYLLSGGSENLLIGSQVDNNTLVSGIYASNTLSGGSGRNLYILNNQVGWDNTLTGETLPWILNRSGIQSASTLRFTGDAVKLSDEAFAQLAPGSAQGITTANGNNRIQLGELARPIGIQTIIGGVGSDTFTAPIDYLPSVYFDASRGSGNQSLSAGLGNDTLLAGTGNATLEGGDGNNSLRGGLGNNLIRSGVGNSTLDGGLGISTLQAEGGENLFIVRNRFTRILGPTTDSDGNIISETPLVGTVNTYVNFDPIQSTQVDQFAPTLPDGSPSITKSPSFASSDLSSFYNLQYFNLLGSANYGVGNALDNTISAASANALILGMGGNNTLVAAGANSSLYGNITGTYSDPDLYAYAPFDTKTQEFVDGVIGIAGNNSLVANGANSFLDGGDGYNDGNFGSGSNTLIGNGGNSTLVQRHQSDVLVSGGAGTVFTSVDLYRLPDNVSDVVVVVTPQATNSGQITGDGQRMTAGYVAVNDATGGYTGSNGAKIGNAPAITVANSIQMQVLYGTSEGTTYGSPGVNSDLSLNVGSFTPDPKDPANKKAVTLSWSVPTTPAGDLKAQTLGYLVKYRCLDNRGEPISPWLTYLSGTSQDLNGTSANPRLLVDNLPNSSAGKPVESYDFQVIAQETVLPAVTDMDPDSPTFGQLIARPVSLIGSGGSEVIFGDVLDTPGESYSNTRAVLNNNPVDPADPGTIATPAPWNPTARFSGLFPTYQDGKGGDDLLLAPIINDGSGKSFTAWQNIGGVPTAVTFSGLNTMEGGTGSDTFVVSNGGTELNVVNGVVQTSAYDQVIKYGLETPAGQNNLVISAVEYLTLSDTDVSQGKFINQASAAFSDQYVAGNRLDNTLVGYGSKTTLLGAGGRDSIYGNSSGTYLLGGTAYGLDSIAGALQDLNPVLLGGNGFSASIYRDYDPVPVTPNGPGTGDPSQYWMVNGPFGPVFDPLRNSDTLVSGVNADDALRNIAGAVIDGGAGYDSMVGGTGNDTLYVSSINTLATLTGTGSSNNTRMSLTGAGYGGDVVVGGGGNDWIVLTGSDIYWSGRDGASTAELGYTLNKNGDAAGGQSISNIKLQDGSPVARRATGNATSTGNQHFGNLGEELGSNQIIGNEQDNALNGGGVGGVLGTGVGVDTLTGGAGADQFVIGADYRKSDSNSTAETDIISILLSATTARNTYIVARNGNATDADYAVINDFSNDSSDPLNLDTLQLTGSSSKYAIGTAPSSFERNNIRSSGSVDRNQFGIYDIGGGAPNLVAVVNTNEDISLGDFINISGKDVDGTSANYGGGSFTWDTNQSDALRFNGLNYLGVGPMYQLQGSDFAARVTFA